MVDYIKFYLRIQRNCIKIITHKFYKSTYTYETRVLFTMDFIWHFKSIKKSITIITSHFEDFRSLSEDDREPPSKSVLSFCSLMIH